MLVIAFSVVASFADITLKAPRSSSVKVDTCIVVGIDFGCRFLEGTPPSSEGDAPVTTDANEQSCPPGVATGLALVAGGEVAVGVAMIA